MAGLRGRVLSGAAYGVGALVLGTLANLLATPFFYRQLGEAGYAAFGLLSGGIAFAHLLALGTHEAVLYFLAKPRGKAWDRQAGALTALVALGAGLGTLMWVLSYYGFPWWTFATGRLEPEVSLGLYQGLLAAGTLWLGQHLAQSAWAFYRARLRLEEVGSMQAATALLPVLGALAALKMGAGLAGFLWAQALVWVLVAGWALWRATQGKEAFSIVPHWEPQALNEAISYSRWALLLQIGFTFGAYADRLLAAPLGSAALSVYSLSTSLTLRVVGALGLVATLVVPAISRLHAEHGLGRAGKAHGLALRATFWASAAAFVPLAAAGPALLGLWVGPDLELRSQGWMLWLCVGAFGASLSVCLQSTLLGLGRPRIVAVTSLLGLAAGCLSAWVLRGEGLFAVAAFSAVAAWISLLARAAWLHGKVLAQFSLAETGGALLYLAAIGWLLKNYHFSTRLGGSLAACLAAMATAAGALFFLGLCWDHWFSRKGQRDSLWSILRQRLHAR